MLDLYVSGIACSFLGKSDIACFSCEQVSYYMLRSLVTFRLGVIGFHCMLKCKMTRVTYLCLFFVPGS